MYDTIDELRSQLGARVTPEAQQAYADKMLHRVPEAPVVDRAVFILDKCRSQRVLEFGASGPLHDQIRGVASAYLGVDLHASADVVAFDLDDVSQAALPVCEPDVIVCGEVLEHLGNPQWFLTRLRRQYAGVEAVITVPNAFTAAGAKHIARGIENVNRDHVAWYSFATLRTLLARAGYRELWFGWYHGQPLTAEGLLMVVR